MFNDINSYNPSDVTLDLAKCPQTLSLTPRNNGSILIYGHQVTSLPRACLVRFVNLSYSQNFRVCIPRFWLQYGELEFTHQQRSQLGYDFEFLRLNYDNVSCRTNEYVHYRTGKWYAEDPLLKYKIHLKLFTCLLYKNCEYIEYHFDLQDILQKKGEDTKVDIVVEMSYGYSEEETVTYTVRETENQGRVSAMFMWRGTPR